MVPRTQVEGAAGDAPSAGDRVDPDNVEARHALGYSQVGGKWATRDEVMIQRGYRKYKGKWMLPQEIEEVEKKRNLEGAQQEWFVKVKRWRGWLVSGRDQQVRDARENIRGITDPQAVRALAQGWHDDPDPHTRILLVAALAKIDTFDAAMALAVAAISDGVEEVRLTCLDYLQTKKRPEIVSYFVSRLNPKKWNNETINLAGVALGRMGDPSAIGPLIDAVVTTEKRVIPKAGGDGSTSATFGNAPGRTGGGMSAGGGPTIIYVPMSNQCVLDALVALDGPELRLRPGCLEELVPGPAKSARGVRRAAQLTPACYCGYHSRSRTSTPLSAPTNFCNSARSEQPLWKGIAR